jgi:hypothetical protein
VVGGERDVVCWVPVFGADFEGEGEGEEVVDGGDYGAAIGDGEGAVLYGCCVSGVVVGGGEWEWRGVVELTGGQKSSWTSTTIRAGLKTIAMALVIDGLEMNKKVIC